VTETEPKKQSLFGRLFGRGGGDDAAAATLEPTAPEAKEPPKDVAPPAAPETLVTAADALAVAETLAPAVLETPVVQAPPPPAAEPEPPAKTGWFQRLRQGLSKTSTQLSQGITSVFTKRKLDAATLDELEDLLIQADLGLDTATRITGRISDGRYDKEISADAVKTILAEEVEAVLSPVAVPLSIDPGKRPHIILVVGVNGAGKTTTIGKLARQFVAEGRKVMLAAGDTFRAAAIEQLKIWGERTGSPVMARETGADAAGLAYDALVKARELGSDVLIIDTAGRLQNKANLMAELEKIVRVIKKIDETGPHSVLLTLDATTGQNALNQVEIFKKTAGVTGLIMTKLDGTARGGILVAISYKYKLPVHAIGVGEGAEDLQPFDAGDFARAIAGL
jgi:fused signal recognition particle receptor